MSAAAAGNAGGVRWLLQAGADVTAADTRGRTALDYVLSPAAKVRVVPAPFFQMLAHVSLLPWLPGQTGRVTAATSAPCFLLFFSQPQRR
jgi:hypothetical protein